MRYSEIFKISAEALEAKGVFNADVDADSQLHIDPSLFKNCQITEFIGIFYRVPADNRTLNYDKYFVEGDTERVKLTEFNSSNTRLLSVEETKSKIASLEYIQNELKGIPDII